MKKKKILELESPSEIILKISQNIVKRTFAIIKKVQILYKEKYISKAQRDKLQVAEIRHIF